MCKSDELYDLVVTKSMSHDTNFENVGHTFDDVQIMKVIDECMILGL